jgi:cellulose synthase/poly-beta-1,6-N-acetylglucosamine synthase-like glycosyltransferase
MKQADTKRRKILLDYIAHEATIEELVAYYRAVLALFANKQRAKDHTEQINAYNEEARKKVTLPNREFCTFAPFQPRLSALQTTTIGQKISIALLLLLLITVFFFYQEIFLVTAIAVVTLCYLGDLFFVFFLSLQTFNQPADEHIPDEVVHALTHVDWPLYTILCPLYHEVEVVPQFINAMQKLDYPDDKLQILLLVEEDDTETSQCIESMGLPKHFNLVRVPTGEPRTKPRACNFGLLQTRGDFVVIYDAEDIPDPLQLKKAVLTFASHDENVACVQAKLNFYNTTQNILTRWFTAEYSLWFDLLLPSLQKAGLPLPLGGTSNHFRVETLRKLGAWDAFNVAEDCDLGIRLAHHRFKTVMLNSTTYEEANSQLKNWVRQRSRWIKGYMQTYLVYMRRPLRFLHPSNFREFLSLQLVVGGKVVVLFINPCMWVFLLIYLFFQSQVEHLYKMLFSPPVLYMGLLCFIFGNFFYVYSSIMGCMKRRHYSLIKWTLFIFCYWVMASAAGFIALFQLIFKPHYWEKTRHGLHLRDNQEPLQFESAQASIDNITEQPTVLLESLYVTVLPSASHPTDPDEDLELLSTLSLPSIKDIERVPTETLQRYGSMTDTSDTEKTQKLVAFKDQKVKGTYTSDAEKTQKLVAFKNQRVKGVARDIERVSMETLQHDGSVTDTPDTEKSQTLAAFSKIQNSSLVSALTTPQEQDRIAKFVTQNLEVASIPTRILTSPVMASQRIAKKRAWYDPWLLATIFIACITGILAIWYFFDKHLLLTYKDSYSHLLIARRLFDNLTPGLAQLGGIWLPLPHILMLPFVWNDYLWHTGLAGSFVGLPCYIVASIYLFLAARRVTGSSRASFVGTLLFILNPNVLYLQATPLSEIVLIATMAMTFYHFLAWIQSENPRQLVLTAFATYLTTLSRYDGWFMFAVLLLAITLVSLLKRHRWSQLEGNLLAFSVLGGLGMALWILWCAFIFGNPLFFQSGRFSSEAQQKLLLNQHSLFTYHNIWLSVQTFGIDAIDNVGLITFIIGIIGVAVFLMRRRFSAEMVAGIVFLFPFAFYVFSLFTGQAALYVPGAIPAHAPDYLRSVYGLYNARYGVQAVAPFAFFAAILAHRISLSRPLDAVSNWVLRSITFLFTLIRRYSGQVILASFIIEQSFLTVSGGMITLQDGIYGMDCAPSHAAVKFLAQHYNSGLLLIDLYNSALDPGIDFKNVVYEGSGPLWEQAIKHPATTVDWIMINPDSSSDILNSHINVDDPVFLHHFTPLSQDSNGLTLYHRNNLAPLPTRAIKPELTSDHPLCASPGERVAAYQASLQKNSTHLASSPTLPQPTATATPSITTAPPLPTALPNQPPIDRPDFQTGIASPHWASDAYGNTDIAWRNGLQDIHSQVGAKWIEMPLLFSQASLSSTRVVPDYNTPSLTSFEQGIRTAHALGYHVFVTPLIHVQGEQNWAGAIRLDTYEQQQFWFNSYWRVLRPYVEVAARTKVEQLAIGTEEEWLQENAPDNLWNELIERIHTAYSGTLTYDMNWTTLNDTQYEPRLWMKNPALTTIGVSAYFSLIDAPEHLEPSQIVDLWEIKVKAVLDDLAIKLGKPILISEIGYRNSADALYKVFASTSTAPADPEQQAAACDAVLANVATDPNISGVFFWGWDNVGGLSLRGLPAASVIHSYFAAFSS